jgi:hypothetical protein
MSQAEPPSPLPGEPGWPEPGKVWVWDAAAEEGRVVTIAEAAEGMTRYARSLGPGTPACGEVERQTLELTGVHPKTGGRKTKPNKGK